MRMSRSAAGIDGGTYRICRRILAAVIGRVRSILVRSSMASDGAAEGHMCTCTGLQGLTSNELNTGRCDECGKAVIV